MSLILDGTNGLSDVDGSAATPAIRGTDANTGIFFPAADTIAFSEGGVEQVRIDSAGNVGIGTASPTAKVTISGTGISSAMDFTNTTSSTGKSYRWVSQNDGDFSIEDITAGGVERIFVSSTGNFAFNSGYGSAATAYGCRAWVNFNGTGTPSIRGSGNVSSITDSGTGLYRINFTTAMSDVNYATLATSTNNLGISMGFTSFDTNNQSTTQTNTLWIGYPNGTLYDPVVCNVAVFR